MSEKNYDKRTEATISLDFPFTVDGVNYDKLVMRRPKTKDSMAAARQAGTEADRTLFILSRVCNVSPSIIEELDEIDLNKVAEQYAAFTGRQLAS